MNKRILATIGAVLAISLLGACSNDTPAPVVTVTASPAPQAPQPIVPDSPVTPDTAPSKDQRFIDLVNETATQQITDEDAAIEFAHLVCEDLDAGSTVEDVLTALLNADTGVDPYDVGVIVAASIVVYCPAYSGQLDALIEENRQSA